MYTIDSEYLDYLYKEDIMQLFSSDVTISFFFSIFEINFASYNMKKLLSKIAHDLPKTFFFSIDNQPKGTSINDVRF